jgi:putative flippase GtrA
VPASSVVGPRPAAALVRQLGAFGVVGAVAFVVDVGLFQVLYDVVGVDAVLAKLTATLVSMTVAFVGHRSWSFANAERSRVSRSYLRFAAVNTTTLLMGLAIVWVVAHPLGQQDVLVLQAANLASIALGTVIRFLAYRRWVFPAALAPAAAPAGGAPASLRDG